MKDYHGKAAEMKIEPGIDQTVHSLCNVIEAEVSRRIPDMDDYALTMREVSKKLWFRFHGESGGDHYYQWPAIESAFEHIGADDPALMKKVRKALLCYE